MAIHIDCRRSQAKTSFHYVPTSPGFESPIAKTLVARNVASCEPTGLTPWWRIIREGLSAGGEDRRRAGLDVLHDHKTRDRGPRIESAFSLGDETSLSLKVVRLNH